MKKIKLLLILYLFLFLCVSFNVSTGNGYASQEDAGKSVRYSILCNGFEREFVVHFPYDYNVNEKYPLVLCFHGKGGSARHTEKKTGFSNIADRENFIVVYPDGINKAWYLTGITNNQPDDINFAVKLVEHLSDEFSIDKTRIYAAGHSNGGFLSIYLAIKHSDIFAAIGSVAGGMTKTHAREFNPETPISVMLIHGKNDTTVPFDGGSLFLKVKGRSGRRFKIISVLEQADLWVKHNKCVKEPVVEQLPNNVRLDGTTVIITTWSEGQDDTDVVLYTINGGKHGWPTKNIDSSSLLPGTCREIETAEEIWKFFASHAKSTDTKRDD